MSVKQVININLPGSKSYTNRALICAALADGRTRLFGYGECEDTLMMAEALKKMGLIVQSSKFKIQSCPPALQAKALRAGSSKFKIKQCLEIRGGVDTLQLPSGQIYVGNAGTTMRFLASFIELVVHKVKSEKLKVKSARQKSKVGTDSSAVILTGSERMLERPIGDLLEALGELGIRAEAVGGNGCPPVIIQNSKFKIKNCPPASQAKALRAGNLKLKINEIGGRAKLKGDASSQYLSSILLCAPYFNRDTEIEIIGELTSKPYVDMTIQTMQDFGVKVENRLYRHFYIKAGQKYQSQDYQIEPDASAASYFIAGAALTGQTVRFPGLSVNSKQGDVKFATLVAKCQMSNVKCQNHISNFKSKDGYLEFQGTGKLKGITVDMNAMPDMVPTLAALAMFSDGRTVIRNVANLRIKESDRLKALATEIRKFGVKVKEFSDGLEIIGNPELQITNYRLQISTYNDHRIAMAFAVAKLALPDIIIENPECTAKSFPKFWNEWHKICIPSL